MRQHLRPVRFHPSLAAVTGSPAGADWGKADVIREAMRRLGLTDADKPAILMVGDRKYDVLGAAECGIACVGVEFFGYAAPGELAEAGRGSGGSNAGGTGRLHSESLKPADRPDSLSCFVRKIPHFSPKSEKVVYNPQGNYYNVRTFAPGARHLKKDPSGGAMPDIRSIEPLRRAAAGH